jgi:hypothetical protein
VSPCAFTPSQAQVTPTEFGTIECACIYRQATPTEFHPCGSLRIDLDHGSGGVPTLRWLVYLWPYYAAYCGSFSLRRCNQRSNEDGLSDEWLPGNRPSMPMSSSRSGQCIP